MRVEKSQYLISTKQWNKRQFCSHTCSNSLNVIKAIKVLRNRKIGTEEIEKRRLALKGKTRPEFSKEWKENLSKSHKGQVAWNKGLKGYFAKEQHYNWKGGINYRDKHSLFNPKYVEWRSSVFTRDIWKCRIANKNCKGQLEVHHILPWRDYVELRYNINNGITLCHAHHPRKRAEEKRLSPFFHSLVSVSK